MEAAELLRSAKTVAVVGLSDDPARPSHQVASYLMSKGYRIIPVNPGLREWEGIRAYPSLSAIPKEVKVDIVDIFRRSEHVLPIVEQAIEIGAKAVWMQLGVINEGAAEKARRAGLEAVMDLCMKSEHMRLLG